MHKYRQGYRCNAFGWRLTVDDDKHIVVEHEVHRDVAKADVLESDVVVHYENATKVPGPLRALVQAMFRKIHQKEREIPPL